MKETFENAKQNVTDFAKKVVDGASRTAKGAVEWGIENKELVIAAIPVILGTFKATQSFAVNHRIKSERKRIDHTYYDPSTGMHWELRRKATNNDRAELMRRKAEGQDTYTILRQLGLIK